MPNRDGIPENVTRRLAAQHWVGCDKRSAGTPSRAPATVCRRCACHTLPMVASRPLNPDTQST